MRKILILLCLTLVCIASSAQSGAPDKDGDFVLAFPEHRGQLRWSAKGFEVVESSAKPNGNEIGIRAKDASGRITFLGFLFLVPGQAPLTSEKCRADALEPEKRSNPTLKIDVMETINSGPLPAAVVSYTTLDKQGKTWYLVRGFVASGDLCGDLEFYSDTPIRASDPGIHQILATYRLDPEYVPTSQDAFIYAQILYNAHMYLPAAAMFELALSRLPETQSSSSTQRRLLTDQAGMAYGISGNIAKARAIFEGAIAKDPDYPLYYYNLACADAEEKDLAGARNHLQEAFARKANVIPGEQMPDPLQDDSFLPYRNNKEFWGFLSSLQTKQ